MPIPESAVAFVSGHVERLRSNPTKHKIVFPEGEDDRILAAAARLAREQVLEPILIGKPPVQAPAGVAFIDPSTTPLLRKYAGLLYERRKAKGMTELEAEETARKPHYFAALMLAAGDAAGEVGAAVFTTAETVRAALHAIGLRPEFHRLTSAHVIAVHPKQYGHNGLLLFSDAAVLIDPTPVELAEMAIASAETTRALLKTEPLVALLSFSTKGSAKHPMADKVIEALRIVQARAPHLNVDGELQADAALVPFVGGKKCPGSPVAGRANTLIFPDLNSANIGYKLVERLGDGALLAVVSQGLRKPVNILSRGCSAEDAFNAAVITAAQVAESATPV